MILKPERLKIRRPILPSVIDNLSEDFDSYDEKIFPPFGIDDMDIADGD